MGCATFPNLSGPKGWLERRLAPVYPGEDSRLGPVYPGEDSLAKITGGNLRRRRAASPDPLLGQISDAGYLAQTTMRVAQLAPWEQAHIATG